MRQPEKYILVVVLAAAACGCGRTEPGVPEGMLSLLPHVRWKTAERILEKRARTVRLLIDILGGKKYVRVADDAFLSSTIRLLGELRAEEAAEPLAKHLMFLPEGSGLVITEMLPKEAYYPAANSLIQIGGDRVVRAMLDRIVTSEDEAERHLAAWVIMETMTFDEKKRAADLLDIVIGRAAANACPRLEEAKEYILNWRPIYEHPRKLKKGESP